MKRSSAVECAEGVSTRMGNMDRAVRIAWKILAVSLVVCLWSPAGVAQVTRRGGPPPGPGRRGGLRARRTEDRPPFLREAATPTGTNVSAPSEGSRLEVLPGDDGGKTIGMDVYGLDIDHLLRILSDEAQVTIIKDEEVRGTVTIIAPKPVPIEVAFQILDSVLAIRGYTMLRTEIGIYKVVSVDKARQSGAPLQFGARLDQYPPGDELVTQVIPLENLDASDLANQLQSLLSPNANIVPTSTNSLIITDTAENISRALELIEDTERQLAGGPHVYPLQYYDAGEMAALVTNLVLSRGGGAQRGPRPAWERRVVGRGGQQPRPTARATAQAQAAAAGPEFAYPDARTNSLIVLATPVHLMQIENLIAQLDRPVSLRDTYFVYPVQNLVASELAELLAPLINAQVVKGADTGSSRREVGRSGTAFSRQPQQYGSPFAGQRSAGARSMGARSLSPSGGRFDGQSSAEVYLEPLAAESSAVRASDRLLVAQAEGVAMQPAVAPQAPPPPTGQPAAATYEDAAAVTGAGVAESVVAADDNTNTLLISAPPEQIDLVKQMLEKLDVLPPQVHIRAIIAEVLLTHETSLGFEWQSLGRTWGTYNGEEYTGDIGTGFGLATPTDEAVPTGFFATITDTEFQAVLNALTADSNTRILAAPSIFTTNNQEAEINVSQQIPIPTGTFQSTVGAETISTSIRYESVGIVLNVTPTVTQGDMVRFVVDVTSNDVGADVEVGGQVYPSILNRSANAVLNLRDGDTVVLGGLMRDGMMETAKRVPILGSLPLVGFLFRSTTSTNVKSELLVFLTLHIVRTPGEAARLTEREKLRLPEVPRSLRQDAGQVDEPEYWPSEFEAAEPDTAEVPAPEGASALPDDAAEESAPTEEEWQEEPMGDTADSTSLPPEAPQPEEVSSPP